MKSFGSTHAVRLFFVILHEFRALRGRYCGERAWCVSRRYLRDIWVVNIAAGGIVSRRWFAFFVFSSADVPLFVEGAGIEQICVAQYCGYRLFAILHDTRAGLPKERSRCVGRSEQSALYVS